MHWTNTCLIYKTVGVRNMDAFKIQLLPKHFKHDKFSSFQRQLSLYGFRKITRGREAGKDVNMHVHLAGR